MEVIRSQNNTKIKNWCKLQEKKYREREQKFLIENEHLILEAISAHLLDSLILLEDVQNPFNFDGNIIYVSEDVMKKLKMNQSLPQYMAVVNMPKAQSNLGNKIIICDDVQDPGNLGTMIRSSYSFGFDTCIVSNKSVDIYNDKMRPVEFAATMGFSEEKKILQSGGAYFVHRDGQLLGAGWLVEDELLLIVSAQPGADEQVLLTIMSVSEPEQLRLDVASTNERAIRFYERMGMIKTAEKHRWYRVFP